MLGRVFWVAGALAVPSVALAAPSYTAQVTDVADAADEDNPFDLTLQVGFSRTEHDARIERENVVNGRGVFANELNYSMVQQQLDMHAAIGIYHDLELNWYMPYIFNHDQTWSYASGVGIANSSVTTDPTTGGPLFNVPYQSHRHGLDHMDIGLAWSPFNDTRDDTKPTWTLRATYGAPMGPLDKPSNAASTQNPGPLDDRTHLLKFETDLSKRFGYLEPYSGFKFTLPIVDGSGLHNLIPPLYGGFFLGFEVIPWENIKNKQRFSVDFRGSTTYYGPGRYYTELTDPLHQLTDADDYVNFTGGFHLFLQAMEYLRVTAGITYGYDTPHVLTNENVGNSSSGVVTLGSSAQNPYYNPAIDAVGHRFRLDASTVFNFYVALALTL